MYPIGTIALVTAATDSYPLAGLTAAAFTIAAAFAGPAIGRWMDRSGHRRVGLALLLLFLAASAGLVAAAITASPGWVYPVLAAGAGATLPNIGAIARVRWTRLLQHPRQVDTAQALESINDEVSFLVGPALVALMASRGPGWLPVALAAVLAAVGIAVVLTMHLPDVGGRAPEATSGQRSPAGPRGRRTWASDRRALVSASTGRIRRAASLGDWRLFLVAMVGVGSVLGTNTVLILAYSTSVGDPNDGALPLVMNSLGSLIAGIAVGAVHWWMAPRRRFAIACVVYAVAAIPMAAVDGFLLYTAACFLAGTMIAPTLIQANAHVAVTAHAERRMEAFAWVSSGIGVGLALGSAVAGWLVGAVGPDLARWGAPALATIPAIVAVTWDRRYGRRSDTDAPAAV
jgi:MFS family permease